MIAKDIITENIPVVSPEDKGQSVLNFMEMLKVSHLPVVKKDEYLGLISDRFIYDLNLTDKSIDNYLIQLHTPHVHEYQHIAEIIAIMGKLGLTVLPVVNEGHTYRGVVTLNKVAFQLSNLLSLNEPGGVIILQIPEYNFSMTQISQIAESNDVRILSFFSNKTEGSEMIQLTLKLNKVDISGLMQTFDRYGYQIASVFMDDSMLHDLYEDRLEQFIRYINV